MFVALRLYHDGFFSTMTRWFNKLSTDKRNSFFPKVYSSERVDIFLTDIYAKVSKLPLFCMSVCRKSHFDPDLCKIFNLYHIKRHGCASTDHF